ncbi:transposase [Pseudorhodobacter aquimaris]|uniref:transposase n=1 Tax=Pseudorhodobacter aquimaris TaxID=687412 RepID=UPI001E48FF1D|nr:transposase [Pseudorhodobacter aquimaris]
MTISGVGPIVLLSFFALVDDPAQFRRASDGGAFFGFTPRRYQSDEMGWSGRISNAVIRPCVVRWSRPQVPRSIGCSGSWRLRAGR